MGALSKATSEGERTLGPLAAEDVPERLAEALARQLARILDDLGGSGEERAHRQLDLINSILMDVRHRLGGHGNQIDNFHAPLQLLHSIHRRTTPLVLPDTGLAMPWLFTAGKGSPLLVTELRHELAACDEVDILVSFITHSGVRKLLDILQSVTSVGADGQPRSRLRVLTTTYTGITEIQAVDELARLPGCQVKVSLDGSRTRLHAKSWLFRRKTGFGSAYVGSANLSGAALVGGLEWTVKFTERGQLALFERAKAHFETLWDDGILPATASNERHSIGRD